MIKSILIVDTYYPLFLESLDTAEVSKVNSYLELGERLMGLSFGTSDAYSTGLRKLNWHAAEVVPNFKTLQSMWAHENSLRYLRWLDRLPPSYLSRIPLLGSLWTKLPTLQHVLDVQIEALDPEVVYFQDLNFASVSLLKKLRRRGRLVVGQIASPLPPRFRLRMYDLILSSLPNQIEEIVQAGVSSEFLPIAFDTRVLNRLPAGLERDIAVSFVGGISPQHGSTIPLLKEVLAKCPELEIFGYGSSMLDGHSELRSRHRGERWGLDMYEALMRSQVTLNRHIGVAGPYANNMRLFEATGVGSLLVTDLKKNIRDYFEPGVEVLAYESPAEAAELCRWAVDNPDDARKIAAAGQARTLRDHTYDHCMVKLDAILRRYL